MKKNAFLTFCCAMVPGCGQMYQGYMKRGVSLLAWACGASALAMNLGYSLFLLFVPVIWIYSFFDTFNIRNLSPQQRDAFEDTFLPNVGRLQGETWGKRPRTEKILGWACIVVGGLVLFAAFRDMFLRFLWNYFPSLAGLLEAVFWRLPPILIAAAAIVVGVKMLAGGKKGPAETQGGDEDA